MATGAADDPDWPPAGLVVLRADDAEAAAHEALLKAMEKDARGAALWSRLTAQDFG